MTLRERAVPAAHPSRQLALAAQPHPLLGFQLRHFDQMGEHAEPVAPRQPAEVGERFGDEARGFIRSAIAWLII